MRTFHVAKIEPDWFEVYSVNQQNGLSKSIEFVNTEYEARIVRNYMAAKQFLAAKEYRA